MSFLVGGTDRDDLEMNFGGWHMWRRPVCAG